MMDAHSWRSWMFRSALNRRNVQCQLPDWWCLCQVLWSNCYQQGALCSKNGHQNLVPFSLHASGGTREDTAVERDNSKQR